MTTIIQLTIMWMGKTYLWLMKKNLSMIITTETVYLKDGTAISGNKVIVTWLGWQILLVIRVFLQTFPMMLMNCCFFFVISDRGCFTKPCKWNKQVCTNLSHKDERYLATIFKIQTMERQCHFIERYESIHCPDILFWNTEKAKKVLLY